MRRITVLAFLSFLFAAGCSTLTDDQFLVQKLDDEIKAKALTEQGIQEYTLRLVRRGEYDKLADIRLYFSVALRFDPENVKAAQYLELVDDFKDARVREKVKEANRYLSKQKRKEDEDFALLAALQAAARLDPSNKDVAKGLRDTAKLRLTLTDTYVARSQAAVAKVEKGAPAVTREATYVEAFQTASRAVTIDPDSGKARGQRDALRGELANMFSRHAEKARMFLAARKYDESRTEVAAMADLNRKVGGAFDAELREVSYALNYQWAASLYAQKDYARAGVRVDAALSVDRTAEAATLKRKILDIRFQADKEASFDTALQEIDRLIAKPDLVGAKKRIEALARVTREQAKLDILDDRREKLKSFLKDIYDTGVAAYRDEKFKDAIDSLQTVVQIDVNYEQASDYLDKAKAKQKLLEQY